MPDTTKNHVELYQLVIAVILVLGSTAKTYVDMNSRLAILESKRNMDDTQTLITNTKFNYALEKILDNQTKMMIQLESKQNRSNQ